MNPHWSGILDESGEWNGKHKGIDDYLAAIKQNEGTGNTLWLFRKENNHEKKRKYGSWRTHYLPVACFSRSGRKTLWCLFEVSRRGTVSYEKLQEYVQEPEEEVSLESEK